MAKAIALVSGGLDSILAARVIKEQGIEVVPINFKIPFCHRDKEVTPNNTVQLVRDNLGKELKVIDISVDFLKLLDNPRHGFGSNMNPCIDCKILMLSKTKDLMEEFNAQFVVTGEVLGQRPMSQHKNALQLIARNSGLEGLVVRPLSARVLFETTAEIAGWVKRDTLLGFSGRSRKPQIALANKFGIKGFAWPAGGCLLTDREFSQRLKDLIAHQELNIENIALLKLGRHFRIAKDTKLVVGRNEKENLGLEKLAKAGDFLLFPNEQLAGPTALYRGKFTDGLMKLSAGITCRYCDLNGAAQADIIYKRIPEDTGTVPVGDCPCVLKAEPVQDSQLDNLRI